MESEILAPLDALENSLNSLVNSLTTSHTFSNAPTASKDLLSADNALVSALNTLKQHQANYTRILDLRAEAERLNGQIKTIIRTCVDLRSELGNINPDILEDSDDEENDGNNAQAREVDYKTLLNFAARIGKHNAVAANQAEAESIRRTIEARKKAEFNIEQANGDNSRPQGEILTENKATEESSQEVNRINDAIAMQRSASGMAFPAAEDLRRGALGQLEKIREDKGEQAVEAEIEKMMRNSENVTFSSSSRATSSPSTKLPVIKSESPRAGTSTTKSDTPKPSASQTQQAVRQVQAPAPVKRKLDLDFPGSDDEDED